MISIVSTLVSMACLSIVGFCKDLKDDERGLSGVVVAILLILVGVLAVAALWALLGPEIAAWWQQIINAADDF